MSEEDCYTIPKLAQRLGVTPKSVRNWIGQKWIEPPSALPVTGERNYTEQRVQQVERWYMERAANGATRGPGAQERREAARDWLAKNPRNGTPRSRAPANTPAAMVTEEVKRWLELEDDLLPVVPLVVAVANRLPGPPVWLIIVAPPSSGKSEVILGLTQISGVRTISTVTP